MTTSLTVDMIGAYAKSLKSPVGSKVDGGRIILLAELLRLFLLIRCCHEPKLVFQFLCPLVQNFLKFSPCT